jgi:hypothetical protein
VHLVRKRYHLRVFARNGSYVLCLRGDVDLRALVAFLQRVRAEHGYWVESRLYGIAV